MTRQEFSAFVTRTLEDVVLLAAEVRQETEPQTGVPVASTSSDFACKRERSGAHRATGIRE